MDNLMQIGVSHNSAFRVFPELPEVARGWMSNNAMFKLEGVGEAFNRGLGVINTGLGNGQALRIFNQGIVQFERMAPRVARSATDQ